MEQVWRFMPEKAQIRAFVECGLPGKYVGLVNADGYAPQPNARSKSPTFSM
jgi:hypothetical protein